MEIYNPTQEALEEWLDLIGDVAIRWGDLMDASGWDDLPPDACKVIIKASKSFAHTSDVIKKLLKRQEIDFEEED